ncbi:MAG: hypothetical protein HY293_16560 [Planctomycetes bacterium]|nr:hypothetical protein [Planctomycetota bacterium]
MKTAPVILGMLLAVSLLFNVVAFVRLKENDAPAPSARKPVAPDARPAIPAPPVESPAAPAAAVAPPVRENAPVTAAAPGGKTATPLSPIQTASLRNDPKVREVLQAGESFNVFWRDLDRVVKARSRFEEPKYVQTVTTATSDFLELGDPNRAQFEEASKIAAANYAQAKKEHDAAKAALPPKDKANPTSFAAYEQQKDAIDLRFQTQVKSAVDSLKPYLNLNDARHQEFVMSAERWLRNLAPKPAKP